MLYSSITSKISYATLAGRIRRKEPLSEMGKTWSYGNVADMVVWEVFLGLPAGCAKEQGPTTKIQRFIKVRWALDPRKSLLGTGVFWLNGYFFTLYFYAPPFKSWGGSRSGVIGVHSWWASFWVLEVGGRQHSTAAVQEHQETECSPGWWLLLRKPGSWKGPQDWRSLLLQSSHPGRWRKYASLITQHWAVVQEGKRAQAASGCSLCVLLLAAAAWVC